MKRRFNELNLGLSIWLSTKNVSIVKKKHKVKELVSMITMNQNEAVIIFYIQHGRVDDELQTKTCKVLELVD